MKNIIQIIKTIIIPIVIIAIFSTACNEDEFLKETPRDAIYAENLYVDYTGFTYALNALNRFVADEKSGRISSNIEAGFLFKLGTDNAITNTAWSTGHMAAWYTTTLQPTRAEFKNVFNWLYGAINSANMIISRAEDPDVDWEGASPEEAEANKNYVVAHAKLVWTWAYRHLTYTWGPVPLSKDEINGLTYRNDWIRESVDVLRNEMEIYLLFAEEHLLQESNDPTVLTKGIARHYLAELYLAMDRPVDAEKKAALVANDTQYSLITARYGVNANKPGVPFMDQFYDGNVLRSQGNTETLWSFINAEETPGGAAFASKKGWMTRYDKLGVPVSAEYGGRGIALAALTAYAFDVYDDPNDDRFSEYAIRKYWVKPSGDTIWAQMTRDYEPTFTKKNNYKWACTTKYDWVSKDPALVASGVTNNDMPYLRVAETYLLLAEALMKNGKNTDAAEWINKLRRRANASEIAPGDVTLDFILDERSRELLTEEHRRHTLARVGKLYDRTMMYNKGAKDFMQPYHVLLPIPQSMIDANTGAPMEQNPGY